MTSANGYRLKLNSIVELSAWLDDLRSSLTKNLTRHYGAMVAKKAVELLDKDRMGISDLPENTLAQACEEVRSALGKDKNGIIAPELNCIVKLYLVHDAILAIFTHGSPEYKKIWDANKAVVKWGWSKNIDQGGISNQVWVMREKYWTRALSRKIGAELQFSLINDHLPNIGWGAIWRYLPTQEERIANAIEALKQSDPSGLMKRYPGHRLQEMVLRSIDKDITKLSFVKSAKNKKSGSDRIRKDVKRRPSAAKDIREKLEEASQTPQKAHEIDHADVIVASNNKIFVAVPYVGLDHESRVFVQVGDKHVAFSQNSVQYGFVDNVQRSSLDILRGTNQVVLVEIEKRSSERLLRAKHMAIVTDISLQESFGAAINRFHQLSVNATREKELKEWERLQTTKS